MHPALLVNNAQICPMISIAWFCIFGYIEFVNQGPLLKTVQFFFANDDFSIWNELPESTCSVNKLLPIVSGILRDFSEITSFDYCYHVFIWSANFRIIEFKIKSCWFHEIERVFVEWSWSTALTTFLTVYFWEDCLKCLRFLQGVAQKFAKPQYFSVFNAWQCFFSRRPHISKILKILNRCMWTWFGYEMSGLQVRLADVFVRIDSNHARWS